MGLIILNRKFLSNMEHIQIKLGELKTELAELKQRREKQLQELIKIEKLLQSVKNDLNNTIAEVF